MWDCEHSGRNSRRRWQSHWWMSPLTTLSSCLNTLSPQPLSYYIPCPNRIWSVCLIILLLLMLLLLLVQLQIWVVNRDGVSPPTICTSGWFDMCVSFQIDFFPADIGPDSLSSVDIDDRWLVHYHVVWFAYLFHELWTPLSPDSIVRAVIVYFYLFFFFFFSFVTPLKKERPFDDCHVIVCLH